MNSRTIELIGQASFDFLQKQKIAVIGLGGVGGHCCEALARAGIQKLHLIDGDIIEPSNLNRQIIATQKTIGKAKTLAMQERLIEIKPELEIKLSSLFIQKANIQKVLSPDLDFIVDAIDDLEAKVEIIQYCQEKQIDLIVIAGAAKKLDPSRFELADIYQTSYDPICKLLRQRLKKLGIKKQMVVYSKEPAQAGKNLGSISFVPASAGLLAASYVINTLLKKGPQ